MEWITYTHKTHCSGWFMVGPYITNLFHESWHNAPGTTFPLISPGPKYRSVCVPFSFAIIFSFPIEASNIWRCVWLAGNPQGLVSTTKSRTVSLLWQCGWNSYTKIAIIRPRNLPTDRPTIVPVHVQTVPQWFALTNLSPWAICFCAEMFDREKLHHKLYRRLWCIVVVCTYIICQLFVYRIIIRTPSLFEFFFSFWVKMAQYIFFLKHTYKENKSRRYERCRETTYYGPFRFFWSGVRVYYSLTFRITCIIFYIPS